MHAYDNGRPKRLDYLQWTFVTDEEAQKVLNKENEILAYPTPSDIPEDGKKLFEGHCRVVCERSLIVNENKEECDYICEFKNKLKAVGLQSSTCTFYFTSTGISVWK